MTDHELDEAIAHARAQPGTAGLPALEALHERTQREREPLDPALGRTWDALVQVAGREPEDLTALYRHAEGRARWLAAARGPGHPETIDAWAELGEAADLELAWEIAARAWEAIVAAPSQGLPNAALWSVSRALRGLASIRHRAGQLDAARALFEQDLALNLRLHPGGHAQLALSHGNLALLLEEQGEAARALAERERQREILAATGASEGQLTAVDGHLARLRGA